MNLILNEMKKITALVTLVLILLINGYSQQNQTSANSVVHLTNEQFKKLIFNYETSKEWKYLGNKPAIIDFYANWCGPCKVMSPRIEEIAKEYAGKIIVYKVDTDKERLLATNLGIQSLPTLVFIPQYGKPQASMGAIPKTDIVKTINEVLFVR
jgi:thioredoxin 1